MMKFIEGIGGLRLTLIGLSFLSLPMVAFADMYPEGIGVLTAYIIPSVVVLFFFVHVRGVQRREAVVVLMMYCAYVAYKVGAGF